MNEGNSIYQLLKDNHTQIDVFFSVIDNYGDIGFATELLLSFEREFPHIFHFRIFTDNCEKTEQFFSRNKIFLPSYEIHSLGNHEELLFSPIIFLLFHFSIPQITDNLRHIILRIDYLSFDSKWIENQGREHLLSTPKVRIYEMIPSLLSGGAGILPPLVIQESTRKDFIEKYGLPKDIEQKKWITIFVYSDTLVRFDFSKNSEDTVFFILGEAYDFDVLNIISLPFLTVEEYHTLLSLSDMNIVRGEVSALAAMVIAKPFLWDMYKYKGGFPHEMSMQFLEYFNFSFEYRENHNQLNMTKDSIYIDDIWRIAQYEYSFSQMSHIQNSTLLVNTLKKYIDRFYFSL